MIETALCDSFKLDILSGIHSLQDEYRMALYGDEAGLGHYTTSYTEDGEVSGDGYQRGGVTLLGAKVSLESGAAALTFDAIEWSRISVVTSGCMIYNASKENRAVAVFSFGNKVEARNGRLSVNIPANVIRIR